MVNMHSILFINKTVIKTIYLPTGITKRQIIGPLGLQAPLEILQEGSPNARRLPLNSADNTSRTFTKKGSPGHIQILRS